MISVILNLLKIVFCFQHEAFNLKFVISMQKESKIVLK
jgi:hypothetical protein